MPKNTVDACMFCGFVTCECGKKRKPTPLARAKRATPKPPVAQPAAPTVQPASRSTQSNLTSATRAKSESEEALGKAITAFAEQDMLHYEELVRHRAIIDLPEHVIDRMIWRQENRASVESN